MASKNNVRSQTPATPHRRTHKQKNIPVHAKTVKQIQKSYESFYTLFHFNPLPTILTRLEDHIVINVNLAFLEYLDLKREDIVGHNLHEFSAVPKQFEKMPKEDTIKNYEEGITLPSGEKKTMLTSTRRVYIENMDAILSTFIDITERVNIEQQIHNSNIERANAELNERRRIAQLLHDDLQQRIFAIKMHLERLEESINKNDTHSAKDDFAKLEAWLAEAIALTRKLSSDLNPLGMPGGTLAEVITWLASEMKEQYGLETKLELADGLLKLDNNLMTTLLHALRELLFNVVKHAGALHAVVTVERSESQPLKIMVADHGMGFQAKTGQAGNGMSGGLANIRQQLKLFGCDLEIESIPHKGTCAIINVPTRRLDTES